jgi:hypothetical protein
MGRGSAHRDAPLRLSIARIYQPRAATQNPWQYPVEQHFCVDRAEIALSDRAIVRGRRFALAAMNIRACTRGDLSALCKLSTATRLSPLPGHDVSDPGLQVL